MPLSLSTVPPRHNYLGALHWSPIHIAFASTRHRHRLGAWLLAQGSQSSTEGLLFAAAFCHGLLRALRPAACRVALPPVQLPSCPLNCPAAHAGAPPQP